jgi:hypothetical protein
VELTSKLSDPSDILGSFRLLEIVNVVIFSRMDTQGWMRDARDGVFVCGRVDS